MRSWASPIMALLAVLAGCQTSPGLPPGFAGWAREAPDDEPLRLWIHGQRIVGVAVPLGPGGLTGPVRAAVEAIAPGGTTVFAGREWSLRGEGYRVEKDYPDRQAPRFRSVLVDADGAVLERSHDLALADVPPAILLRATPTGAQVERVEIVSGPAEEEFYRLTVRDRIGRSHMVDCAMDGGVLTTARILHSQLRVR